MKADVVVVGGGPAGAASAMFLAREGIRSLIVEQQPFPRYHIGESLTGAGGKVLRELGLTADMDGRRFPQKQGVKVFGTSGKTSWFVPVTGRDEHWKIFDWHTWQVRRSIFDEMMLNEAVARGATLLHGRATKPLLTDEGAVRGVEVSMADGGTLTLETEMLLDCSGQATWLANLGGVTGPKYLGNYDRQIAFFSQVTDTVRDSGGTKQTSPDNTLIFYLQKFHWSWFIPLDDDVVSVGVVIPAAYFLEKKEHKRDFLVRELQTLNPEMPRRMPNVRLIDDIHVIPNYSYQVRSFAGKGFICIGDAHRFIDPIFSFGVTVAMREAQFMAPLVRDYLAGANRDLANPFAEYQRACEMGIDVLEDTIDLFWERPFSFAVCVHQRYTDLITDLFAGRIYEHQPSAGILAFRRMLRRERERSDYSSDGDAYSVPVGSRYHPERAPLWEPNADVESTEEWMGAR